MTESENNRIKELTDRFFEGETTVEEERELYALYLEEDIPEEMEEYFQEHLKTKGVGKTA